jgi:hypothetical protein
MTIKAKITSATTDAQGKTTIHITLTDFSPDTYHTWDKDYTFASSEEIDLNAFKNQVIADIRRDLQISAVLNQITPLIGREFSLDV